MTDSSQPTGPVDRLVDVMARLRSEDGCPWDREQTLESLKPYLLEESYELFDAIDSGDPHAVREEMGDVLLQVVFQAQIARELGWFDFYEVAAGIADKLIHRHPHVFADTVAKTSGEVLKNWERIKKEERTEAKGRASVLDGVPRSMPALQKAHHVQKKAARVGFDWDVVEPILDKIDEELREVREAMDEQQPLRVKEEIGDLLFAVVNLSRFMGHSAEEALHGTVEKFSTRFRKIEDTVHARGKQMTDYTLDELDAEWEAIKAAERAAGSEAAV